MLEVLGNVAIVYSAVVAAVSVALHARVFDRRSPVSVHLLAYGLVVSVVLALAAVRALVGDAPWFAVLRLVVFLLVPVVLTWRLVLQVRAQRRPRPDR